MRSEIERIRNVNFEEIDRRVSENKQLLERMWSCLEQKKVSTPMAILAQEVPIGKLKQVRELLQQLAQFQRALREEVERFMQGNH